MNPFNNFQIIHDDQSYDVNFHIFYENSTYFINNFIPGSFHFQVPFNFSQKIFEIFIHLMNGFECEISYDEILPLLEVCEKLEVQSLEDFLSEKFSNVIQVQKSINELIQNNFDYTKTQEFDLILQENFEILCKCESVKNIPFSVLIQYVHKSSQTSFEAAKSLLKFLVEKDPFQAQFVFQILKCNNLKPEEIKELIFIIQSERNDNHIINTINHYPSLIEEKIHLKIKECKLLEKKFFQIEEENKKLLARQEKTKKDLIQIQKDLKDKEKEEIKIQREAEKLRK